MSLTQLFTRAQIGIDAPGVSVEVHISNGLPRFTLVGLPETAVREARDRVRSAIVNSGFEFPDRRITVNLAPADLPKVGGRYDLPIALGILAASRQIRGDALAHLDCYGELALSGACAPVNGLLPALIAGKVAGRDALIPAANTSEGSLIDGISIHTANSLAEICEHLNRDLVLPCLQAGNRSHPRSDGIDMRDVVGQQQARHALEIAAAGGHHLLMVGPPGCGKSMLAQRLPTIQPNLTETEALGCAAIRSACHQRVAPENWYLRPFQSPHHTVSAAALAGGGSEPRPGEISLAHNGVLFLDELTEFDRRSIEVLREPLETGQIHISRAARQATFPARFQLVAAMNPCPRGCESVLACDCSAEQLRRYRNKLSAPLLDRIDLQIELSRLVRAELVAADTAKVESSASIRRRVERARGIQSRRQQCLNANLDPAELERLCRLDAASRDLLTRAMDKLRLSARSYHKLLRVARTIADLAGEERLRAEHIGSAIVYRQETRWLS